MSDYRDDFYAAYHLAVGASAGEANLAHYRASARQYRGRWRRWLPADRNARILDLGCGCGEFLYFLRASGYRHLYGVDLNETEIALARQVGLTDLTCGNALEYLADKSAEFDLISALNLFEHLRKKEILSLLGLVYRALKPGGRLLAVTPNGLSPFGGATRYWDFSHETGFTPAAWRQLARLTGFQAPVFEEYGPLPHSVPGIIRTGLWQCVKGGLDLLSLIEVGGPRDPSRVYTADIKIILQKKPSIEMPS